MNRVFQQLQYRSPILKIQPTKTKFEVDFDGRFDGQDLHSFVPLHPFLLMTNFISIKKNKQKQNLKSGRIPQTTCDLRQHVNSQTTIHSFAN